MPCAFVLSNVPCHIPPTRSAILSEKGRLSPAMPLRSNWCESLEILSMRSSAPCALTARTPSAEKRITHPHLAPRHLPQHCPPAPRKR
eukprot:5694340-Pleurochrysis_carterae.AAC.1